MNHAPRAHNTDSQQHRKNAGPAPASPWGGKASGHPFAVRQLPRLVPADIAARISLWGGRKMGNQSHHDSTGRERYRTSQERQVTPDMRIDGAEQNLPPELHRHAPQLSTTQPTRPDRVVTVMQQAASHLAPPGTNKTWLPLQTPSEHVTYAGNHLPAHPVDTTTNSSRTPWLWK